MGISRTTPESRGCVAVQTTYEAALRKRKYFKQPKGAAPHLLLAINKIRIRHT